MPDTFRHDTPWCTACRGLPPDLSGDDLQSLHTHLAQCAQSMERGEPWRHAAHVALNVASQHLLTTMLGLMALWLLWQAL